MATKTKGKAVEEQDQTEPMQMSEDMYSAESLNPALEQLFAEMGMTADTDATVHVSKLDADGTGTEAAVWRGDPDDYDLESIARKFGSGQYRVKVYVRIPTGQKVRKANKVFAWLLSPEDEAKRVAVLNPPAAATADNSAVLQALGSMNQNLAALIEKVAHPPAVNPLATLEGIKAIADIIKPAAPVASAASGGDFTTVMNNMRTFMELSRAINPQVPVGEDGKTDVAGALLTKGLDIFGRAIEARAGAQSSPAAAAPGLPAPAATAATETPPDDGLTEEQRDMLLLFKAQLRIANRSAAGGEPPAEFADDAYDMIGAENIKMLQTDAAWFAKICELVPDCQQHAAWYQAVRAELIRIGIEEGDLTGIPESGSVSQDGNTPPEPNPTADAGPTSAAGTAVKS